MKSKNCGSVLFKSMRYFGVVTLVFCTFVVHAQFRIDYFGNMGVAICKDDSAVFVDAFHSFYGKAYLPTSPQKLLLVQRKESSYKNIPASMATHIHGDHFDPELVLKLAR